MTRFFKWFLAGIIIYQMFVMVHAVVIGNISNQYQHFVDRKPATTPEEARVEMAYYERHKPE